MPTTVKVSVCLFVLAVITATSTQAQGTGKPLTIRSSIAAVAAATNDEHKKAGLVGWLSIKDGDSGMRVFVRDKTKLEKMVGKERQPATFADLKNGSLVEIVYVPQGGQPSKGDTLVDAKQITILAGPK